MNEDLKLLDNPFAKDVKEADFRDLYGEDYYFKDAEDDSKIKAELFTNVPLEINEVLKHIGIFGTTGCGKTNTVARLLEAYAETGLAYTCWDYEATSFFTIPEKYPDVKFIKLDPLLDTATYEEYNSSQATNKDLFRNKTRELNILSVEEAQENIEKLKDLAEKNYLSSSKTILSMENLQDDLMRTCMAYIYTEKIYELADELMTKEEQLLHMNFFDEGYWAAPWLGSLNIERNLYTPKILEMTRRIAAMGRKRWCLLGIASQRLPDISISITSQLQNVLLMKASAKDLIHYSVFLRNLPRSVRDKLLSSTLAFPKGRCLFVQGGNIIPTAKIMRRKSRHVDVNASYYQALKRAEKMKKEMN